MNKIIFAEIINQPISGKYKERIYQLESKWKSQVWTWIRFTDENGSEIIGQFQGIPIKVKISKQKNKIIVLTSEFVILLDSTNLNIIESENQPDYVDVEVSPSGDFIVNDYYEIKKISDSLSGKTEIKIPFKMDDIKFGKWENNKLIFSCEEFGNWSRNEIMELNSLDWTIKISEKHSL